MPRVPAFALRGLRRAGARFLGVAMKHDATAELFFRRDRDLRRPGEPFLLRLVVQKENRSRPRTLRAGWCGELEAAGDEGAQPLELDPEPLPPAPPYVAPPPRPQRHALAPHPT